MTVIKKFPHGLAASCVLLVATPAAAAGLHSATSVSSPAAITIRAADGHSCSISAHALAEALRGESSVCNQQMGEVLRINATGAHHNAHIAHRDVRTAKPLYDHTAWFSRPRQNDGPHYFGERVY